ncbi:MAG: hypothetical protein RLZ98_3421 [Pseudomonadota bacterium]
MFYLASKLFALLFTPSNFIAILLIAGTALVALGFRPRLGLRLAVTGAALLVVCGFLPLGTCLTMPLEERFKRTTNPGPVAGIILLGGYEDPGMAQARGVLTVNEAAERLLETMLLARRHPDAVIVISGAWATLLQNNVDATAPVAAFLMENGIPGKRIIVERKSRNTYENAVYTSQLLKPRKGQRFILVTSAYHMPRSVGTFRAQGMDVVAWPSDYRTYGWSDAAVAFRWATQGLERTDLATKEWLGLLAYWMTGRTSALFPAP